MKGTSIKKVLILVTILAVPGFLYYLLQEQGKNRYKPLPFFGPKKVATTFHSVRGKQIPDTIYHQLGDFKLVNQAGDTVSKKHYDGKILVVNLFYTQGNTASVDIANKAMQSFEFTYRPNKKVNLISLSIDPVYDTPTRLKPYAEQLSAKPGKWDLLTGDSTQIYNLINKGLSVDAHQELVNGEKKFVYSNMFVLLDYKHRIRGYYEATSKEDLNKLDDEIKVLIIEELRNNNDGR
ncbi:redoxin domain-containing protein [Pedobacter hiemivivus]|uniref:Redoxin domain-containing protein n=1 Tax=Pedobacter hiemivivus TaxID=2530454 RepID=A0A4U1G9A0_9SPHI|nr:SCO family protein [Pedobacter hiemivivus]TKC60248.1 redoxin domain-containing protein [Pedobacter hiemivivus]